jgi:phospholipid/cholesterol/gamma-HCH transport system permease protein
MPNPTLPASLSFAKYHQENQLQCLGAWTLAGINQHTLALSFERINKQKTSSVILDARAISAMDSSGAWQLHRWIQQLAKQGINIQLQGLRNEYQTLFTAIQKRAIPLETLPQREELTGLTQLGKKTIDQLLEAQSFLQFVGQSFINGLTTLLHPKQLRFNAVLSVIENTGVKALGIIALLSFMIGIVLTYQMGFQLKNYGATLFIIDLLGLAILREFAPLLTAIMIAGRSGSAFTAQLGMMKIKEEIDALNTMGVLPNQLLILPRIWGLTLALPLLTIWADVFGILGGMAMTHSMLHIGYMDFLRRFPKVVELSSLLIGIGKAPVFALIIASIACFQGLRVQGSADSVGKQTTRSVVQSIFFIIVADALFSILFSTLNI